MSYNNFKYKANVSGNVKPQNTHLAIENYAGTYIYFVDSADNKILKKLDVSDGSISTVTTRGKKIAYAWHEADFGIFGEVIFFMDSNHDDSTVYWWYLDVSDDSVNEAGNRSTAQGWDTFLADALNQGYIWTRNDSGDIKILVFFGDITEYNMGSLGARTYDVSQVCKISSGVLYYLWKWSNENVELWKRTYGDNTYTQMEDCGANTDLPDSQNQRAIAYDGSDLLYFVLKDTSDSKTYLYSYSISGDSLTKIGEYNVALMMDRNTASGVLEKGFHITEPKIYQISSGKAWLYHIATLTTSKTIQAITDNYVILE